MSKKKVTIETGMIAPEQRLDIDPAQPRPLSVKYINVIDHVADVEEKLDALERQHDRYARLYNDPPFDRELTRRSLVTGVEVAPFLAADGTPWPTAEARDEFYIVLRLKWDDFLADEGDIDPFPWMTEGLLSLPRDVTFVGSNAAADSRNRSASFEEYYEEAKAELAEKARVELGGVLDSHVTVTCDREFCLRAYPLCHLYGVYAVDSLYLEAAVEAGSILVSLDNEDFINRIKRSKPSIKAMHVSEFID